MSLRLLTVAAVAAAAAASAEPSSFDNLMQASEAFQASMLDLSPAIVSGAPLDAGKLCDACESYVEFVNAEVQMIKDGWSKARGPFQEECDKCPVDMVRQGCAAVAGFVDNALDQVSPLKPDEACGSIGLCQDGSGSVAQQQGGRLLSSLPEAPSAQFCDSCEQAESMVKSYIKSLAEQWPSLRERLSQQCSQLSTEQLKAACQQGLDKVDGVVAALANAAASMSPCEQLGCSAPTGMRLEPAPGHMITDYASPADAAAAGARLRGAAVDAMCNTCEDVSHWVAGVLRRVADGADQACDPITDAEKHEQCEAAAAKVAAAAQAAASSLEADRICFMCKSASSYNWATHALLALGHSRADAQLCHMCSVTSAAVKSQVAQILAMWTQVRAEARKVCKQLPGQLSAPCLQSLARMDSVLEQAGAVIQGANLCGMLGCEDEPPAVFWAAEDVASAAALA